MNERLAMIAKQLGEVDLEEKLESTLNMLRFEEATLLRRLNDEIDPDGIYDLLDRKVDFKKRSKTYLVTNMFDENYVVKIAKLEKGEVERPDLRIELGKVRIARMEKELHKFRSRISSIKDALSELHLNEILYDVPCSGKAIKWHQAMFGEPEIEVLSQLNFRSHNWSVDGF